MINTGILIPKNHLKSIQTVGSTLILKIGILGLIMILGSCKNTDKSELVEPDKYSEYIGRYSLKTDLVLEVNKEGEFLTLLPSFWGRSQILDSIGTDKFAAKLHPQMRFEFKRDSTGKIISLSSTGNNEINGTALRLDENDYKVVELLLSGNLNDAIKKLEGSSEDISEERVVNLGFTLIMKKPSKVNIGIAFVSAFESRYPNSVDIQHVMGLGNLLADKREDALRAFEKSNLIDPENSLTKSSLRLLRSPNASPPPADSWNLPFELDKLFKKPSQEEIENVWKDWNNRDLSVKQAKIESKEIVVLNDRSYEMRILSHTVHGSKHYGAVLIPEGAKLTSSPIIVDLRGVDPNYSPLNIMETKAFVILEENKLNTLIAIPSFRGNTLTYKDNVYVSEGSPTDAWDGATDDAMTFLSVVLDIIPEADPNRISVFGHSRGGTVALLLGIRDKRVSSVIDWAGPSDWFSNMGTFGWTLQELVQWALWEKWSPGQGWGSAAQFIDQHLSETIRSGKPGLIEIRHQMLASSPLYFLDSLPTALLQYGVEDRSVSISNAHAIKRVLEIRDNSAQKVELIMNENTGHDQPYPKAYASAREFLLNQFSSNK